MEMRSASSAVGSEDCSVNDGATGSSSLDDVGTSSLDDGGTVNRRYNCTVQGCSKSYPHRTNLSRHMKQCKGQKKVKSLSCPNSWCSNEFKTTFNLTRHQLKCVRPVMSTRQCQVCKITFTTKYNLERHIVIHSKPAKIKITKKVKQTPADLAQMNVYDAFEEYINQTDNDEDPSNSDDIWDIEEFPPVGEEVSEEQLIFEDGMYTVERECYIGDGVFHPIIKEEFDEQLIFEDGMYTAVSSQPECSDRIYISVNMDNSYGEDDAVVPKITEDELESNVVEDCDAVPDMTVQESCDSDPGDVGECSHVVPDVTDDVSDSDSDDGDDEKFAAKLAKKLKVFLKREINGCRHSIKKSIATAKLIKRIFSTDLEDEIFLVWLSSQLGFKTVDDFNRFLKYSDAAAPILGRRSRVTSEVIDKMYNFWKENSEISVDRRNNRNAVKVYPRKLPKILRTIHDDNIIMIQNNKGKIKMKGHKHIYTKPIKTLCNMFMLQSGEEVSPSTFYKYKPFYIEPPTLREMESCTCILCVNPHYVYKAYRRNLKKVTGDVLPDSLTEYLTSEFKCCKDNVIDYFDISCINGTCENECSIKAASTPHDKKLYTYIQFEPTVTKYKNKEGETVEYKRCARTERKASLAGMQELLVNMGQKYLQHRYIVSSDKAFWSRFRAECPHPIIHIDYSENIKLVPKNEVQTAHYSGRQHTLHCCVLFESNKAGDHEFVYHLSDDTNHDDVMTFAVIEDIIKKHPGIIAKGKLVIRSDNCSTQYKSRFTFGKMAKLAKKHGIDIFWFYGASGHGRGLVDAMSSFGCKGPMKKAIVTEDNFWDNASAMVSFLDEKFEKDNKKSYYLIKEEETAKVRRKKHLQPENPIPGSSKLHLIAVNPEGDWLTKVVVKPTDEKIMSLSFNEEDDFDDDVDVDFDAVEDVDEPEGEDMQSSIEEELKFDFVAAGSFLALFSSSCGIEQFYLVEVVEKGTANENMQDSHGHVIRAGRLYAQVAFYEKVTETKKDVRYRKSNFDKAYIHMNEICCVNVEFDGKKMSMQEYASICQEIM